MSYQGTHSGAEVDDAIGVAKGTGTGIAVKTGTGAGVRRSIAASARLTITNADGVAGNPALDFAQAVIDSLANADTAHGWGDHSLAGYVDAAGAVSAIKADAAWNATDWDTAYSWGDHSLVGYALDSSLSVVGKTGSYSDLTNKPDLSALEEVTVYSSEADFPATGEADKVYIAEDTGYMYRWNGTSYTQMTDQTAIWGQISGTLADQTDLLNDLNTRDTANRDRANHSGTQTLATISDAGTSAATDAADYATAAQGALADTAIQPGDSLAVPHVVVSASKTLALSDANTEQQVDAAATLTIPTNATVAFDRGTKVAAVAIAAGTVTITAVAGVTLNGVDGGSTDISAQYKGAVITKIGTDAWMIIGDISGVA